MIILDLITAWDFSPVVSNLQGMRPLEGETLDQMTLHVNCARRKLVAQASGYAETIGLPDCSLHQNGSVHLLILSRVQQPDSNPHGAWHRAGAGDLRMA